MFTKYQRRWLSDYVNVQLLNESSLLLTVSDAKSPLTLSSTQTKNTLINTHESSDNSALLKNQMIQSISHQIISAKPDWLVDCVPAYSSLLIEFCPLSIDHYQVIAFIHTLDLQNYQQSLGKNIEIPVCYEELGLAYPNDTDLVSSFTGKSPSCIHNLHSAGKYRVFAVGFMPNFAYLGKLDKALNMPRLKQPRLKVPAGAVAIADEQTAIYPSISPGGWHIIAYTPLNLLASQSDCLSASSLLFTVGDTVSFKPISARAFTEMLSKKI